MCYCYSQSDQQSSYSNTTNTTDHTNQVSATDSDSNSELLQKSKPWLSRMFTKESDSGSDPASPASGAIGSDFNAAKHFHVRHDFNRPAGVAAAPGGRISKTGRKIRWERAPKSSS